MYFKGETLRDRPRLKVLQGWHGNESQGSSHNAAPLAGQDIKSGMAIVLSAQGLWVKATDPRSNAPVYFAVQDQTDVDVIGSGVLLGLSSLGTYKLETAQIVTASTFVVGQPVTASSTGGQEGRLVPTTFGSGDTVVGVVAVAKQNLGPVISGASFKPGIENIALNQTVIVIDVYFDPLNGVNS